MSTTATTTTSPSSTSVEQQILHLIQNPAPLQESEVEKLYNKLKPLPSREFLFGSWKGGAFETGHKGYEELKKTKWAGKDFKGVDDVDPIIVYNEKGEREKGEEWGGASVSLFSFSTSFDFFVEGLGEGKEREGKGREGKDRRVCVR